MGFNGDLMRFWWFNRDFLWFSMGSIGFNGDIYGI